MKWKNDYKRIKHKFEELWKESENVLIQSNVNQSEEHNSFEKGFFMFGCKIGWYYCYKYYEDLILDGLKNKPNK